VSGGAHLDVSQNVFVRDGMLGVSKRHPSSAVPEMAVQGSVFVGGPGSPQAPPVLMLDTGTRGDIGGDLIVGRDGQGYVLLGVTSVPGASPVWLVVGDPPVGLCAIGREFPGWVDVDVGAYLACTTIEVGGRAGTSGAGVLSRSRVPASCACLTS
jgi:hypothetical protein